MGFQLDDKSQYLAQGSLMVVSSVNADGSPAAAVVGFSRLGSQELIFATANTSRKYANIIRDGRVALTIGWSSWTLQVEGRARLAEGAELETVRTVHAAHDKRSALRADESTECYFIITPTWMRFSDYSAGPTAIEVSGERA